MKRNFGYKILLCLSFLAILISVIAGCSLFRKSATSPPTAPRTATPPKTVTPPPSTQTPTTTANQMVVRSQRIANNVAAMGEVEKAAAVITGNTALVGVTIKGAAEGKLSNQVKDRIEKIVKDTDKSIKNVVITADPDLYDRIRLMAADIAKGKPLSGFTREINEIINRITPEVKTK